VVVEVGGKGNEENTRRSEKVTRPTSPRDRTEGGLKIRGRNGFPTKVRLQKDRVLGISLRRSHWLIQRRGA
jgi:hypothetical protein